MMNKKILPLFFTIISFFIFLFFSVKTIQDAIALRIYIEQHEPLPDDLNPVEIGYVVRKWIVEDINSRGDFKLFNIHNRPLKGYSISSILKYREGQCGEGTKLMYHILKHFGVNSRRIYIFSDNTMHSMLEVKDGSSYYLLDTINSPIGDIPAYTRIIDIFALSSNSYQIIKNKKSFYRMKQYSYLSLNKFLEKWKIAVFIYDPLPPLLNDFLLTDYKYESILMCLITILLIVNCLAKHSIVRREKCELR